MNTLPAKHQSSLPASGCFSEIAREGLSVAQTFLKAEEYYVKGVDAFSAGDLKLAAELAGKAVAVSPGMVEALYLAIRCWSFDPCAEYRSYPCDCVFECSKRTIEYAEQFFQTGSSKFRGSVHHYLGVARGRLRRYEPAIRAIEKALTLGSDSLHVVESNLNIAWSMLNEKQKDYEGALGFLQFAEQLSEGYDYIFFRRGRVLEKMGRNYEAMENYRLFLEMVREGNPLRKIDIIHARRFVG